MRLYQKRAESAAGCLAACKTLAKGHIYGASYPRRSRVVFLLIDAAARRSGHARTFGVIVVVVVDLLRAVLADLHEDARRVNWAVGSFAFGSYLSPPDSLFINCGSTTRVKQ